MTVVLPGNIAKYMDQYKTRDQVQNIPSLQGFIIAEPTIRNDPDMKLLCAIVNNWGQKNPIDGPEIYDCRTIIGRAQVANVVNACLTYMPSSNQKQLIQELVVWVGYRVAEAQLNEKFFSEQFAALVKHLVDSGKVTPLDNQANLNLSVGAKQTIYDELKTGNNNIDMTLVTKQTIASDLLKQKPVEEAKQETAMEIRTPQPKPGQSYRYSDKSTQFYKKTHNRYAEPQAILTDAQQQIVHGKKYYVLERKDALSTEPSAYELELRKSAHVRTDLLNAPFHERVMSAPNVKRQMDEKLNKMTQFEQSGVYVKLDDYAVLQNKQRIQQIELDRDVSNQTRAYNDGRSKARAIQQQQYMQKYVKGDGTTHVSDVNGQVRMHYFKGDSKQLPLVYDIDDINRLEDKMDPRLNDVLLDRDEDFTGLGVGNLNEVVLKAQLLHEQCEDDASDVSEEVEESEPSKDANETIQQQEQQQTKKAGYMYRKAVSDIIREKLTVPQYDTPIKPLQFEPKQEEKGLYIDNNVKVKLEKYQQNLLSGGSIKLDPKVNQVIEVANNLFGNDDLGLNSSSNEDHDITDSEPSDKAAEYKDADQLVYMKKRSENLQNFTEQLESISKVSTQPSKLQQLIMTMPKSKNLLLKKEKETFDQAEAARIKAWKKKQQEKNQGNDAKPKEPKPKKFVSQVAKRMCNTESGVPYQVQQIVSEQKKHIVATKEQQNAAHQIVAQLPDIAKADADTEKEFVENYQKDQRQTIAFDALLLANIMATKEQTSIQQQIKSTVGRTLIKPVEQDDSGKPALIAKNLTDDQLKNVELLQKDKYTFMQGTDQYQMPYVYDKPLSQQVAENTKSSAKDVTQINENNVSLANRTYLPIQPNQQVANSSRPHFITNARSGQSIVTRQLDDFQSVNDVQQSINKLQQMHEVATKPVNQKVDVLHYINMSQRETKQRDEQNFAKSLQSSAEMQDSMKNGQQKMQRNKQLLQELVNAENNQFVDESLMKEQNVFNNRIIDTKVDLPIQHADKIKMEDARQQLHDVVNGQPNVLASKDLFTVDKMSQKDSESQQQLNIIQNPDIPHNQSGLQQYYDENIDLAAAVANGKVFSLNPYQRIIEKKPKKGKKGKKAAKKK